MHRKLENITHLLNYMQIAKYEKTWENPCFSECAFIRAIGVLVKTCKSVLRKRYLKRDAFCMRFLLDLDSIMDPLGTFLGPFGDLFGTFWGSFGTFWDLMGPFGTFWEGFREIRHHLNLVRGFVATPTIKGRL